ncbi:MAG: A/G-specific adenine glycosylase, partial [Chloroflexi bacterium]|nr:A/G-specific adenine glycosylase [Chloroflexota bacterium]
MATQPNVELRLSKSDVAALRRALLAWHRRHALKAPWRTSGDPYHVLVAAVMAQQTQMSRVLLKFDEFIAAFPTVQALARARTARVLRVWEGMGYNLRALRLHRAAKLIVRRGAFPRTARELEQIQGIGPFTAAIISSFGFREPAAAV